MMFKKPALSMDMGEAPKKRETLQARRKLKANTTHEGERVVRMTFFIPLATHKKLQEIRTERETSLQQLVAEALDEWLLRQGATFGYKPDGGERK